MGQNTRPNPTNFRPLSVEQEHAIELLVAGNTDHVTAGVVGVARTTISEWRRKSPLFISTLNARQRELWEAPQARLLALSMKAVENLAAAVEGGDVKSSIELLKAVGLHGAVPTMGSTDPHAVMKAQVEARVDQECPSGMMQSFLEDQVHPGKARLTKEIEAEIWARYGDDPME